MKDGNNLKLPFQMANVISWEMAAKHSLIFTSGYLGNWSIIHIPLRGRERLPAP
jgi:hypothetical protein